MDMAGGPAALLGQAGAIHHAKSHHSDQFIALRQSASNDHRQAMAVDQIAFNDFDQEEFHAFDPTTPPSDITGSRIDLRRKEAD